MKLNLEFWCLGCVIGLMCWTCLSALSLFVILGIHIHSSFKQDRAEPAFNTLVRIMTTRLLSAEYFLL